MQTKTLSLILVFLMLICNCVFALGTSDQSPEITFNGESIYSKCRTLKSLDINREEVLVSLESLTVILDPAKSYAFTGDLEKDGKLYLKLGNKKQLVGLRVHRAYEDGARREVDPFSTLTVEDMKLIRGICLDHAPSKLAIELMQHVNPAHAFFVITENAKVGVSNKFPNIPDTTMFLNVYQRSSDGIKDFSYLKSLESLLYLKLNTVMGPQIDINCISNNGNMLHLDLGGEKLTNIESLGQFSKLCYLNLSGCEGITEARFLSSLTALRELRMVRTQIEDITPLGKLKNIIKVNANQSLVKHLPKKSLVSLQELDVLSTQLTQERVDAFKKLNPQCQVRYSWTSTLRTALQGVDCIKVRSGGTCHRDLENEKKLFEIKDVKAVNNIITNIVIDPKGSGYECMCCGEPSFEFYKKGELVVTLGFHHGVGLRWMDGKWPGDANLTLASGDFLCELLDKHGVKGPLKERLEMRAMEKAAETRMAVYEKILPERICQRLYEATSEAEALNAFRDGETNKAKRVELALMILGSHNGSWNRKSLLDPIVISLFKNEVPRVWSDEGSDISKPIKKKDQITAADIIGVLNAHKTNNMIVLGATYWFFGEKNSTDIPDNEMSNLLPLLVEAGITSPRLINRRRTLEALEELDNKVAIEELRKILAGKFKVQILKSEEALEPDGMVEYRGNDGDIDDKCSDQALAALILAKLGDKSSLAEIKKLLKLEKESESKKIVKQAIKILDQ